MSSPDYHIAYLLTFCICAIHFISIPSSSMTFFTQVLTYTHNFAALQMEVL